MERPHKVVVVGGGFGGLYTVQSLRRTPVQVTVIDRRNFHLFQPLLYQVATGGLSPANIAAPLRSVLKRQKNARVLMAEVSGFDLSKRRVLMTDGNVPYDSLVVAAGSESFFFGHADWEQWAPALKTVEDATKIRQRILLAFEIAERETDPQRIQQWLTFVVVGGGPTGVELVGALAEIACCTLRNEFRSINPRDSRIILLEGQERILPSYPAELSSKAKAHLEKMCVTVRTGVLVSDIRPDAVTFRTGGQTETISTRTILWSAGTRASPLGQLLGDAASIPVDRQGRVPVMPDLSIPGYPEVFVIGDLASYMHQIDAPLPGVAPVAMQEGHYVASVIRSRLLGKALPSFHYHDYGTMATIGRARAVAMIGPLRLSGFHAWLAWLFVHLMYIVAFQNRLLILLQWAWNYFTWNRAARLITGDAPLPFQRNKATSQETATNEGSADSQDAESITEIAYFSNT
ncbi:MAG: putative NADH dehydrogenase (NDH) [Candidatus Hydrogenedentota bacterium]